MIRGWEQRGAWRGVALTLTLLALTLKVLVPPGFMIADAGMPAAITPCTGQGPMVLDASASKAPKLPMHKKAETPCTGAGIVAPLTPPQIGSVAPPHAGSPTVLAAWSAFA